ncbi:hypothetical protein ABID14_000162 [Peptoniphilus olsenii]|uniref:LysM domain-containing protein n=1 Tax=Peptoniphilus olsenii TaxID=411570 RepID=A0ABV2J6Z0_9FIRM
MKRRYYIKKTKVVMFLLFIFIFNTGLTLQRESHIPDKMEFEVYTVKEGDTIWSIANFYEFKDKMIFVLEIERINKTNSQKLQPGDKLAIPVISSI